MEGCFPRGLVPVGATIDSYYWTSKLESSVFPFGSQSGLPGREKRGSPRSCPQARRGFRPDKPDGERRIIG
jgi:hypothetical protein